MWGSVALVLSGLLSFCYLSGKQCTKKNVTLRELLLDLLSSKRREKRKGVEQECYVCSLCSLFVPCDSIGLM